MYEFDLEVTIVKKLLVVVLALAMIMSLGALAFAEGEAVVKPATGVDTKTAGDSATKGGTPSPSKTDVTAAHSAGDAAGALIVKFDTGEIRVATPIASPFNDAQNTAIALADKVVTGADAVEDEALKAFFAENAGSIAAGVINMGGEAVDGSVSLAVNATGFEKVMFTAPGNAENLGFVVING